MKLARDIRRVAVGYCLIYLNFTINGWDLLPNFVGWLLFYRAILALKERRPKVMLLKNFALVLGAWAVVEWLPFSLMEELSQSGLPGVGIPGLVLQMMALYFHFQFLTELAELAGTYPERMDQETLLRARTGVTVLQTATVLVAAVPYQRLPDSLAEGVETLAALCLVALAVIFCVTIVRELFSLAKELDRLGTELPEN